MTNTGKCTKCGNHLVLGELLIDGAESIDFLQKTNPHGKVLVQNAYCVNKTNCGTEFEISYEIRISTIIELEQ